MPQIKCSTCNENLYSEDNFTRFSCPSCMNEEITRCKKCRRKNTLYVCKKCSFEGP